jgi:hypothetical protein
MIYCWMICWGTGNTYNVERAKFNTVKDCIADPTWAKLPNELYTNTSMDSFHNWMIFWTVLTVAGLIVGIVVFFMVSRKLAAWATPRH